MASGFVLDEAGFIEELDRRIREIGSLRAAARRWRISAAYLSDVRRQNREAGPKLLRALKVEKRVEVKRTVRYHGNG